MRLSVFVLDVGWRYRMTVTTQLCMTFKFDISEYFRVNTSAENLCQEGFPDSDDWCQAMIHVDDVIEN